MSPVRCTFVPHNGFNIMSIVCISPERSVYLIHKRNIDKVNHVKKSSKTASSFDLNLGQQFYPFVSYLVSAVWGCLSRAKAWDCRREVLSTRIHLNIILRFVCVCVFPFVSQCFASFSPCGFLMLSCCVLIVLGFCYAKEWGLGLDGSMCICI